jgi:hypothetical protein
MDQLIRTAGMVGVQEMVIGMAHRGRLNVLVNTLGKQPAMLFDEFEGKKKQALSAGDVKYHMGYSSDVGTPGGPVHLTLAFNPSHLEIVNPVVVGSVYARQVRRGAEGKKQALPVLIHGDAAVAGQGRQPGDAQLLQYPRLRYRWHGAYRGEQPDRLHHLRPPRLPLLALLYRHLQDDRGADLPRQRRRSGSRGAGDPDRHGVPPGVQEGRG